jgi:hypothetical protein
MGEPAIASQEGTVIATLVTVPPAVPTGQVPHAGATPPTEVRHRVPAPPVGVVVRVVPFQ